MGDKSGPLVNNNNNSNNNINNNNSNSYIRIMTAMCNTLRFIIMIISYTLTLRLVECTLSRAARSNEPHDGNKTQFVPHMDVINHFEKCPNFQDCFANTCTRGLLSCSGKCGQKIPNAPCSCKSNCVLQNSCCWDFKEKCPALKEEFSDEVKKFVVGLNKTCERGYRIVEDFENEIQETGNISDRFVIYDTFTGQSYRNMNVYLKNRKALVMINNSMSSTDMGSISNESSIETWGIRVLNKEGAVINVAEVERIFDIAKEREGLQVINVAPSGAEKCYPQVKLVCGLTYTTGNCNARKKVELDNPQHYCEYYSTIQVENPEVTNCLIQEIIPKDQDERYFKQLVDITLHGNAMKAKNTMIRGFPAWDLIEITKSESMTRCSYGYEFLFSDCYAPDHAVLAFEITMPPTNVTYLAVETLITDIVEFLNRNFVISINKDYNLIQNEIDMTIGANNAKYNAIMVLDYYNMQPKQSRHLYISEIVSDFLESEKVLKNLTFIRKMALCLGFRPYNPKSENDVEMICDYIVQNTTRKMEHFIVPGIEYLLMNENVEKTVVNGADKRENKRNGGSDNNNNNEEDNSGKNETGRMVIDGCGEMKTINILLVFLIILMKII